MSLDLSPNPFGPFVVGRGFRIVYQVEEKLSASGFAGKDISDARWSYLVRAYETPSSSSFVINATVSESSTDAATGWLDHYQTLGTTAYVGLYWELVETDADNPDTNTPSDLREVVLLRWRQSIVAAPNP